MSDRSPPDTAHSEDSLALTAKVDSAGLGPVALRSLPEAPRDSAPAASLFDDAVFGLRYEHAARLGEGGMGEVLKVRDQCVGRDVAVKVIRGDQARDADLRARFLREAQVQGQLEHPSVVPVYDLGVVRGGTTYFTMKCVRGETLAAVLDALAAGDAAAAARHSQRRLLSAFVQVCLAVQYAHSRGVVHRDLKPDNVMLGDFGEVYVLDWGIARVRAADATDGAAAPLDVGARSGQTHHGAWLGTPGYMAPEAFAGAEAVDHRADIYALGAILFEILAGLPLHEGHSLSALMASAVRGADARVSVRAPARPVAPELEAACARAVARDPADRFQSARALADAVERYLDGDRDLALRRDLAARHHAAATEALAAAKGDGADAVAARRRALQEVSRALALAPDDTAARKTLLRLLLDPPAEMPPDARDEMDAALADRARLGARQGAVSFLSWLVMGPFYLWLGVREWSSLGLLGALILATAATCWVVARTARPGPLAQYAALAVSTACLAVFSRSFGPWVFVPCVVAMNTVAFVLGNLTARLLPVLAIAGAGVAAPVALERLGWVTPTFVMRPDAITLLPRMHAFPPGSVVGFLLIIHLVVVSIGAYNVWRVRKEFVDAERKLRLHAWQLRQLVPEDGG